MYCPCLHHDRECFTIKLQTIYSVIIDIVLFKICVLIRNKINKLFNICLKYDVTENNYVNTQNTILFVIAKFNLELFVFCLSDFKFFFFLLICTTSSLKIQFGYTRSTNEIHESFSPSYTMWIVEFCKNVKRTGFCSLSSWIP